MSAQQFFRKYLDILNEQTAPPSQEFINQLDTAYRTGEGPGAEVMSGLSRDQQAIMLRNQGAWVNRDRAVQQGENPGARVYNPNQQDIDSREAGIQASLDRVKDPKERAERLAAIQSRDINKPYFTTTQPTATDTKKTDPTTTAPVTTKPATTKPATPAPATTPAPQPYADPIDFQARAGTKPIADTGLGKLSGGVSLGGSASNYMTPSMRAELANQSGGKFIADVGQNRQQLGYQQDLGNGLTGQLALNRNAQGGMSAGIGAEKQVNSNLSFGGGISAPISGQGSARGDIYGKYTFEEELEEELQKILKLSGKSSKN
jgi:hypothetical protein